MCIRDREYFDCDKDVKVFPFTLGTHMYQIFNQLTEGMEMDIVLPYNQEETVEYPTLRIPWTSIADRIEYLHQLLDVTIDSAEDGQVLTWSHDLQNWINKDLPTIDNLSEIGDVSTTSGEEGQVLRLRSGVWSPEDLPPDIDIKNLTELLDVNVSASTLMSNDILVWDDGAFDESDTSQQNPGAWVAKPAADFLPATYTSGGSVQIASAHAIAQMYGVNDSSSGNHYLAVTTEDLHTALEPTAGGSIQSLSLIHI